MFVMFVTLYTNATPLNTFTSIWIYILKHNRLPFQLGKQEKAKTKEVFFLDGKTQWKLFIREKKRLNILDDKIYQWPEIFIMFSTKERECNNFLNLTMCYQFSTLLFSLRLNNPHWQLFTYICLCADACVCCGCVCLYVYIATVLGSLV